MATEDVEFVPAIAAAVEGRSVSGRDEGRRFLEALAETWESFKIEEEQFDEVGEQVVVSGHVRAKGRGSGLELDQSISTVIWFRGDKIARVESFLDPDQALAAAEKTLEDLR